MGISHKTVNQRKNDPLIEMAHNAGAMNAAVISTDSIIVENGLAALCRDPGCENYGRSMSCPPHVSGPAGFKQLLKNYNKAIVFKIDVPYDALFSNERDDWFRLLHEIASGIEHGAVQMGYRNSRAFAGGSCKQIFCSEYIDCEVVDRNGECRHPECARPSMSGFGIDVKQLLRTAGLEIYNSKTMQKACESPDNSVTKFEEMDNSKSMQDNKPSMGTLSGLILIG